MNQKYVLLPFDTPLTEEGASQFIDVDVRPTKSTDPRTLSRLTGVPYSIVQRATSATIHYGSMVCESIPGDEEYDTYLDDSEYEKNPEY